MEQMKKRSKINWQTGGWVNIKRINFKSKDQSLKPKRKHTLGTFLILNTNTSLFEIMA
jgi:hypothetical protein